MTQVIRILKLTLILLISAYGVNAQQPPPNDDCSDATPVGEGTGVYFSTQYATLDGSGICQTDPNIWFLYTATVDSLVLIDLCGSNYPTKMAVYNGPDCQSSDTLFCNDYFCDGGSGGYINVVAGNRYLIEIGGLGSYTGSGVLNIAVTCQPPWNDRCVDVSPESLSDGQTIIFHGNNTCATSYGDCPPFDVIPTVFHGFTIDQCMNLALSYCGTSPVFGNVWLSLQIGCPCGACTGFDSYNNTECADSNWTIHYSNIQPGTYYIPVMLDPAYGSGPGPYTVSVSAASCPPAPPSPCAYTPGDVNGDSLVNALDIIYSINYFKGRLGYNPPADCGTPIGPCPETSPFYAAGDVNGNCAFNGIDITFFVRFLKLQVPRLFSCANCPPASLALPIPAVEHIKASMLNSPIKKMDNSSN